MNGLQVVEIDSIRKLRYEGKDIAVGGKINRYGLYATKEGLFLDGAKIANPSTNGKGLYITDGVVMFGTEKIGIDSEIQPPVHGMYWTPPTQESSTYKPWDYRGLIAEYDKLMESSDGYIKKFRYEKDGVPIVTKNGNYEMYSYILEPENFSKTIFIQAGIHGNEMDSKQQLLKIVDILVNKTHLSEYSAFADIRNDVRLVIIPCVSPYGHERSSMNIPYIYSEDSTQYNINPNRNYDFNQQWGLAGAGVGGYPAFDIEETQHTRDVLEKIGVENIDYAMDWHDGGNVMEHYWINYSVDGDNRIMVNDFINYLIDKYKIENPVIPNCKDTSTTGTTSSYFAKTLGLMGSTVEWIGGYLGYDFNSSQMTQSLELRGNMLLLAYKNDVRGWRINESEDAQYFHFDYPKAFTREGLRRDDADIRTIVTDQQIYERWDKLTEENPHYIVKSEILGQNAYGQNIYTYTFGNGHNKVLYVGGIKRYGAPCKIDEFAIYQLVEYLCDDYIVNQSKFLQELRDNYKIIVLPCIDNKAGNTSTDRYSGLNNMALTFKKWQIVDGKCQPTSNALTYHDIPILKTIIDNNQDLKCIVSGGEIMTGYSLNTNDYTTEFETHIVLPKNQPVFEYVSDYKIHLNNNRNEDVVVETTQGTTFGDYAYDNYQIPVYYVQLKVSKRYAELSDYHSLSQDQYLYFNYEAGRRIANIVNLFLGTIG